MPQQTWRDASKRVLEQVFAELPKDATLEQARKAVSEAYPFGQRSMHPYKIWLSESRIWLDQRFPEAARERNRKKLERELASRGLATDPQLGLWEEL